MKPVTIRLVHSPRRVIKFMGYLCPDCGSEMERIYNHDHPSESFRIACRNIKCPSNNLESWVEPEWEVSDLEKPL